MTKEKLGMGYKIKHGLCPSCGHRLKVVGKNKERNLLTGRMHTMQHYECDTCGYIRKSPR
jgi:hypothetical protein